ncbi:MAG TPA: hypothetical protein VJK05_03445 [archaeon]|nr:hypothetical protein [archaeon]
MLYLLDSGALIHAHSFAFNEKDSYFITSKCFNELKSLEANALAENALSRGLLRIVDPCELAVQNVMDFIEKIKDKKLSGADISVIALARQELDKNVKLTIITDDYSLQNACKLLKIPFESVQTKGIKKARKFN